MFEERRRDRTSDVEGLVVDPLTESGHDEVVLLCTSSTSVTTESWTHGDQSNQSVVHKCSGCSQDYHPKVWAVFGCPNRWNVDKFDTRKLSGRVEWIKMYIIGFHNGRKESMFTVPWFVTNLTPSFSDKV